MGVYMVSPGGASAVGADLIDGKRWQLDNIPRIITRAGFAGSAAIDDCEVEVYAGDKLVSVIRNTSAADLPLANSDMFNVGAYVPAGDKIHVIVSDASGSTAGFAMEIMPAPRAPFRRR